jgi:hypothetical protein
MNDKFVDWLNSEIDYCDFLKEHNKGAASVLNGEISKRQLFLREVLLKYKRFERCKNL